MNFKDLTNLQKGWVFEITSYEGDGDNSNTTLVNVVSEEEKQALTELCKWMRINCGAVLTDEELKDAQLLLHHLSRLVGRPCWEDVWDALGVIVGSVQDQYYPTSYVRCLDFFRVWHVKDIFIDAELV